MRGLLEGREWGTLLRNRHGQQQPKKRSRVGVEVETLRDRRRRRTRYLWQWLVELEFFGVQVLDEIYAG